MGRRLHRFLKTEQLESRRPLAADLAALDVNDDMSVTALDALIIINEVNQQSSATVSAAEAEAELNCDTNSDGVVTPVDVLNVVNQINSGVIDVPVDAPDSTTSEPVDSAPNTGTDVESGVVSTPVDDTNVISPGDTATEDLPADDSDSSDSSDSSDDSTGGSTDPSDSLDETDGTDDDVVSQPTDGSDDSTTDDSNDGTTDDSDNTGDETTDDDTSTGDDSECDHGRRVGGSTVRAILRHGRHHGRGDFFADLDENGDGALSSDEVPDRLWEQLSEADSDASGSVTEEELQAYREAKRLAAVEAFFEQLDDDGSGTITSADVSGRTWRFLSRADADGNGEITVEELMAVPLPGRWGRR